MDLFIPKLFICLFCCFRLNLCIASAPCILIIPRTLRPLELLTIFSIALLAPAPSTNADIAADVVPSKSAAPQATFLNADLESCPSKIQLERKSTPASNTKAPIPSATAAQGVLPFGSKYFIGFPIQYT